MEESGCDEEQIMDKLDSNVKSFGRLLKILLDACPAMEISNEVRLTLNSFPPTKQCFYWGL